jgi:hypothetical protein
LFDERLLDKPAHAANININGTNKNKRVLAILLLIGFLFLNNIIILRI